MLDAGRSETEIPPKAGMMDEKSREHGVKV